MGLPSLKKNPMKNINSLVIGSTSQLSYYFPDEYEKISSRNIDYNSFENKFYERVFICFAEQRTFLENNRDLCLFDAVNVDYTLQVISFFSKICKKLVVYGTADLWNNLNGPIDINMPFNYIETAYIRSKNNLVNRLKNSSLNNIIVLHPVNFNSPYRSEGFLFSKIFYSIINKKNIKIGDTYFYRDMVHPKYVVERSIKSEIDEIIGSGRLIFVNDFIRDLYSNFEMDYNFYIEEEIQEKTDKKIYYLNTRECRYSYNDLLLDTIKDIRHGL